MNELMFFLIYLVNFIVYESFYFYLTRSYYCKKNMGNCEKCKCWSCRRVYYLKRGNKNEKY